MLVRVLTYDVVNMLMSVFLFCSLYKIPSLYRILSQFIMSYFGNAELQQVREFSLRKILWREVIALLEALQKLLFALVIILVGVRVLNVIFRLRRLYRHMQNIRS